MSQNVAQNLDYETYVTQVHDTFYKLVVNASGKAVGFKGRVPVAREKKDDTFPGVPISSHSFETRL